MLVRTTKISGSLHIGKGSRWSIQALGYIVQRDLPLKTQLNQYTFFTAQMFIMLSHGNTLPPKRVALLF